jgi:hypothetical protein
MSDLRARLERIAGRVEPERDAFGRFERARRRRVRNRRIEAGVVAFAVAIAGSLAVFAVFRDSEPRPGGDVEGDFFALWPETTYEAALEEQSAIDEGAPSRRAWRLDPRVTAEEFAKRALGWGWQTPDEDVVDAAVLGDADVTGPGPVTVEISTPPLPCPSPPAPGCARKTASVTLARLVRPDGIWSVVRVDGDAFDLRLVSGERVEVGGFVVIPTTLEEGTEVAVGVKGTGPCTGFHEQTAEVAEGHVVVPVEGVAEGCAGYLYALTPPTPVGQVELGKIMFLWNEDKPALGYTIVSIAAVPVSFVNAHAEPTPSVEPIASPTAEVTCDGSATNVLTPRVAAQPDGVHIVVTNTSSVDLSLQIEGVGGDNADVGEHELVWPLAPGPVRVRCLDPTADAGSEGGYGSLEVVDPDGVYVSPELECSNAVTMFVDDFGEGVGDHDDPADVARAHLTGLADDDVVERAGYPDSPEPVIRIVRDGVVVGRLDLFPDSQGGWLLSSLERCDTTDTVFGWSDEPAGPYPRGWFEWCPAPPFLEADRDWEERATEAALLFVEAFVGGDPETVAALLDPSVPTADWFEGIVMQTEGVAPASIASEEPHPVVRGGCGEDVAAHTVSVAVDDGTNSASADFTVFLVFREDGWKVWGTY